MARGWSFGIGKSRNMAAAEASTPVTTAVPAEQRQPCQLLSRQRATPRDPGTLPSAVISGLF